MRRFIYFLTIPAVLALASCASTSPVAQQIDQNDDVYYSEARAKEQVEVTAQTQPEKTYVTDEELYRDAQGEYAARIYRFRNYTPWRGYYGGMYNYGMYGMYGMYDYFDPYMAAYSPYGWYGGPSMMIGLNFGSPYYSYNPWRYYGYNYGSNFWGPYSYYGGMYPVGTGFYPGGWYGGYGTGYGRGVIQASPNYRARPSRPGESVTPRTVPNTIRNGNEGGRAVRYGGGSSTRPQSTAPRPERVQRAPERVSQPERISTSPSRDSGGGSRSSGPSNGGGGSSSGARPSRAN